MVEDRVLRPSPGSTVVWVVALVLLQRSQATTCLKRSLILLSTVALVASLAISDSY